MRKEKLREEGFIFYKNILNKEEIEKLRGFIINYFKEGNGFKNSGGYAKPDWVNDKKCEPIMWLLSDSRIDKILKESIGENYIFLEHNDIHMDRIVGWHKDRLSGAGKKYEKHNPWLTVNGEKQQIYKLNIYLQDHSVDGHALALKEKTHLSEYNDGKEISINPKIGDIILFDQRMTHRGQLKKYKEPRLLISLGYGIPNIFSEEFILGTMARQNDQNRI